MSEVWYSNQDIRGELIDSDHSPKLKASIRRNAYDFQSSADLYAWTDKGWSPILSRPIERCRVFNFSYVQWDMAGGKHQPAIIAAVGDDLSDLMQRGYDFFKERQ